MSNYTRNNLAGNLAPVNKELEKIEQVLKEKLDRLPEQGQANQLTSDLDVNNNRILNVPNPSEPTDLVRLKDLDGIGNGSQGVLPPQAGQAGEWLRTDGDTAYWDALPDFDKGGVSPEDFGAVGDGVTDDTTALQSAINAAKGDGSLGLPVSYVRLENKTYAHTGLTIDRAVAIVGVDRNSTRLKCLSTSAPAVQVALAHDGNNYQVGGRPGPTVLIKDVIIESDKTFASTNEGIELVNASTNPIRGWVYLDGVDIHSMGGNALKANTWEGAVKANNCKFLNNAGKQLNATSCADWQFVGCEFGVTPDDNILLSGSAAFTFTTCNIYSSTGDLVTLFTDGAATAPVNHHFVSCSFDRASNGNGIVYNVRNDGNVTFTNCYWTYNGQGTPETYSDIWIDSSVRRGPTIVGGWMQDASTSDSLYNIFFNGPLSSCYTTGVQFEAGNARSTNVTNSLSQLKFEGAENFATFADLEACTWVEDGDKATCIERANAKYILQPSGYAAKVGDVTFANGRVGALQNEGADPVKMGAAADGSTDDSAIINQCIQRFGWANIKDNSFGISALTIDNNGQAIIGHGSSVAKLNIISDSGAAITAAKPSGPLRGMSIKGVSIVSALSESSTTILKMDGCRNFTLDDVVIDKGFIGLHMLGCSQGNIDNALVIFEDDNNGAISGRKYLLIEETANANIGSKHPGDLFFSNFNGRCGANPYCETGIEIHSGDGVWFDNYHIGNCTYANVVINADRVARCTGLKFVNGWHDLGTGSGAIITGSTPSTIGKYQFASVKSLGGNTGDSGYDIDGSANDIQIGGVGTEISGYRERGIRVRAGFTGELTVRGFSIHDCSLASSGTYDGIVDESTTGTVRVENGEVYGGNHRFHINVQQSKGTTYVKNVDVSKTSGVSGDISHPFAANSIVSENKGYNPTGANSPTVGASPWTFPNNRGYPVRFICTGGTVSAISINETTISGKSEIDTVLSVSDSITLTYSTTPSVYVFGM